MLSQKRKRGTVIAAAIIAVLGTLAPVPAAAQPAESETVRKFKELNAQAAKLNDDWLQANEDKKVRQAEIDKAVADQGTANAAKAQAAGKEQEFRGQVDILSTAAFRGARFDKLSALLTGTSPEDFLARSTALNVLATDNNHALQELMGAVNTAAGAEKLATDAQRRSTEARDAATKLADDILAKRKELDGQITQLKSQFNKLSTADRKALEGEKDTGVYNFPGAAGKAVDRALSRRGDRYELGRESPPVFDCSGLTMWAYAQAGVKIPRTSREQFKIGKAVSKDALQPGDLLFYGNSAATIHHVAMYIGSGNIVHASDYGIPVKSAPMSNGGKDFFGAKRVVG
ncbi:MAG: NlpC/P60 family protein [Kibdelosporangium sp.]